MYYKKLLIDGQVFQSEAWDRGMGKYSISLLQNLSGKLANNYDEVRIIFAHNLALPKEASEEIKKAIPEASFWFLDLVTPKDPSSADIPNIQVSNRGILNKAINELEGEITFFILALFIGESCSVFPTNCRKALLFYDLIPLQYSERYSKLSNYKNYLAKFRTIYEADLILTISQTVADDVGINLGINHERVLNIDGAAIKRLEKKRKKPNIKNFPKKFILMPSGNELRKNNYNAVRAFEDYLSNSGNDDTALVITSNFDPVTRSELENISSSLIFTGNVTEEELGWLYENSEALLFVPEYEGLGLPILEAIEFNKPVVCSNISVFNEMSQNAFYLAEPLDIYAISQALNSALTNKDFNKKLKEYPEILKKYTWTHTAERALKAIVNIEDSNVIDEKPSLAIFIPTPAGYSAIGKVAMLMHAELSRYFEIDYFVEEGSTIREFTRPNFLPFIANVKAAKKFNKTTYRKYDKVVYHIGNSEFHLETIKNSLYLPGIAIIHDSHLANIFKTDLVNYGYISEQRLLAEQKLDEVIGNDKTNYITSILNNQTDIIVHSAKQKMALEENMFNNNVECRLLNIPVSTPQQTTHRLGGQVNIGLAGIIDPAKGLDVVERLAKNPEFLDTKIIIFGIPLVSDEVIHRLRSYSNVEVHTNLTDFQFHNLLAKLDFLISFRPDERGYPSLAAIEAMRLGVVPVVRRLGWYDELPDDTVLKVRSEKELVNKLRELINQPELINEARRLARDFMKETHSYKLYAETLYDMIVNSDNNSKPFKVGKAIKSQVSLDGIKKMIKEI